MNRLIVALMSATFVSVFPSLGAAADQPETVMVTFRAKAGAEAELARVIATHWRTARWDEPACRIRRHRKPAGPEIGGRQ